VAEWFNVMAEITPQNEADPRQNQSGFTVSRTTSGRTAAIDFKGSRSTNQCPSVPTSDFVKDNSYNKEGQHNAKTLSKPVSLPV